MQIVRRKFYFTTLFTASIVFSFGQQRQADSLTTIVTAIARSNVYEASYTVGYKGTISKQYQRFERLAALATDQQLLTLAEQHKNAVVRLYAFQGLKQRMATIPEQLRRQFRGDKTVVRVLKGCLGDDKPISVLYEQELKSPFGLPD